MIGAYPLVGFVASTDLDRSVEFYGSKLGLPQEGANPFAVVFRAGGTMLRVTKVDGLRAQPFTVLGWDVPDIKKTIQELTERGVEFTRYDGIEQNDLGIWTTPSGEQVAWFADPDGNTLSLTQFGMPD